MRTWNVKTACAWGAFGAAAIGWLRMPPGTQADEASGFIIGAALAGALFVGGLTWLATRPNRR